MRIFFCLTVIGGIAILTLAVWPGLLETVVFDIPFFLVSLPVLGLWFLLVVGLALRDLLRDRDISTSGLQWGIMSAVVMFAVMGLVWFHVPQRIALATCRFDMQSLVNAAPVVEWQGEEFGRRIGPYHVDQYGADKRGGTYFRTATGQAGIGPDVMSYGLAFRPNGEGSPFGNARYRQRRLFGEWYVFAASDDW
jgi:hypothetical protein